MLILTKNYGLCKIGKTYLTSYFKRFVHTPEALTIGSDISYKHAKPRSNSNKTHVYKNLHPYQNVVEFTNYIHSNLLYSEHGVVAINKPFGVGAHKSETLTSDAVKRTSFLSFVPETNFSLSDAVFGLRHKLNMPQLTIVRCPERYTSGVALLAENETSLKKLRKSFQEAKKEKKQFMKFWGVTRGYPQPAMISEKLGIKLVEYEQEKHAEIVDYSKTQVHLNKMVPVSVDFRTLSVNQELSVALVEVETSSTKAHFLRLYMIRRGVCLLGDTMFGHRIATVQKKTVILDPHIKNPDRKFYLAPEVCSKLQLPKDEGFASIPVALHLKEFTLSKYLQSSKEDILITAPIPEHVRWTCERLNLQY